jgi:hypothetical protein
MIASITVIESTIKDLFGTWYSMNKNTIGIECPNILHFMDKIAKNKRLDGAPKKHRNWMNECDPKKTFHEVQPLGRIPSKILRNAHFIEFLRICSTMIFCYKQLNIIVENFSIEFQSSRIPGFLFLFKVS